MFAYTHKHVMLKLIGQRVLNARIPCVECLVFVT